MSTVAFFTLGCKVNQQETAALVSSFIEQGYSPVDFKESADVYVINSCAVTESAERKSRNVCRKIRGLRPDALVVLAGCFPQVNLERARSIGADLLVGSNDKGRIVSLTASALNNRGEPLIKVSQWNDDTRFETIHERTGTQRVRASLKVQDGCEQFCSYCIIPHARGPERSLSPDEVIRQTRELVTAGFKEIVLTGIHLGAYGRDLLAPVTLSQLVEQLLGIPGLSRLRLGSIEPNDVDETLVSLLAQEERLCSHLHIPLQSGCDDTLLRMSRKYTTDYFREIVATLRENVSDLSITSDLIVGFPGETVGEFEETLSFLEEMCFLDTHVFRYSRRKGTPAAGLPSQVPESTKEERSVRAKQISLECTLRNHRQWIGRKVSVLVENFDNGELSGHTPSYLKVLFAGPEDFVGKLIDVYADSVSERAVYGQILQD